ncbi:MAG: DUF3754 domain-containing protein [Planctomycetia bacterium]|nr:DUF3754 domain-containing protein [Planctomycetia bacterium]
MSETNQRRATRSGALPSTGDAAAVPCPLAPFKPAHFIPIRKADLVRLLAERWPEAGGARDEFLHVARLLDATFHLEHRERLEELKNAYAPFDPDADTRAVAARPDEQVDALFDQVALLLRRANYVHVGHELIQKAMREVSDWGLNLNVDLTQFQRLEVFVRGEATERRKRRRLKSLYRQRESTVPTYQRLVVAYRPLASKPLAEGSSREEGRAEAVYLKMFKNIPQMDLDMLLPGTRFKMSLVDRGKIMLPALSGLAVLVYKALTGALFLAVAGLYGLLTYIGFIGGTLGYGVKSILGYQRAKEKYQLNLTRNLYYQNLDNNAGVIYRLLDEAEEQELREAILAYHLLAMAREDQGWTAESLDAQAEALLREVLEMDVDFEVDDALGKLRRLGLIDLLPGNRVRAVTPAEALRRLDRAWDEHFQPPSGDSAAPRAEDAA